MLDCILRVEKQVFGSFSYLFRKASANTLYCTDDVCILCLYRHGNNQEYNHILLKRAKTWIVPVVFKAKMSFLLLPFLDVRYTYELCTRNAMYAELVLNTWLTKCIIQCSIIDVYYTLYNFTL